VSSRDRLRVIRPHTSVLGSVSHKLPEFDSHTDTLPADQAGGGIFIFQVMPNRLPVELEINRPCLVGVVPAYCHIVVAFAYYRIYFGYFFT
jgi:hypothetical protein